MCKAARTTAGLSFLCQASQIHAQPLTGACAVPPRASSSLLHAAAQVPTLHKQMPYQIKNSLREDSLSFLGGSFSSAISCLQVCVRSVAGSSQQHHCSSQQELWPECCIDVGERVAQEGARGVHREGCQTAEGETMVDAVNAGAGGVCDLRSTSPFALINLLAVRR